MNFNELNIIDDIKKSLKKINYSTLTSVQKQVIPLMLENKNVICKSHTGSGKTLAFGIPIVNNLLLNNKEKALIIAPTRELAIQIRDELQKLTKKLKIVVVYGGHGIALEEKQLKNVDILVATPGRLLDHFNRGNINPTIFRTIVLDEADRILDMGFINDISLIFEKVKPSKVSLFSATLEGKVSDIIKKYLKDYEKVIMPEEIIGKNIIEKNYVVEKKDKFSKLVNILKQTKGKKLIFVSTKRFADSLKAKLEKKGFKVVSIHGNKSQAFRERALNDFKKNRKDVLIATDVAARGLQIDDISLVVNYDPARDKDTHKHRIGRTGRMGKKGLAITFSSNEVKSVKRVVEKGLKKRKQKNYSFSDELVF